MPRVVVEKRQWKRTKRDEMAYVPLDEIILMYCGMYEAMIRRQRMLGPSTSAITVRTRRGVGSAHVSTTVRNGGWYCMYVSQSSESSILPVVAPGNDFAALVGKRTLVS